MSKLTCDDRLYISSVCLGRGRDLSSVLGKYHELGFKNIEISGSCKYVSLENMSSVISKFKSAGMNFMSHNYFPRPQQDFVMNLTSKNTDIRVRSEEVVSQAVGLGKKTGMDLYCCHPGYLCDAVVKDDGMFEFNAGKVMDKKECVENLITNFMTYYKTLGLESDKQNFFLGFENLFPQPDGKNYSFFCTKDDISQVFDTEVFRDSNIGLLIDLGHLAISSNILGFDRIGFIDEIIEQYGDRIYEVHLSDNDNSNDLHSEIREGSWQLDVLAKFRDTGKRFKGLNTRFCIESRGLTQDSLISSYNIVKNTMEEVL